MNVLIETLNRLGGQFFDFAWPMLWQSSLLIALVWGLDRALARKIRASVRHALWLVVLVKLLLPPTLALPTGAAWWLFPAHPPIPAASPRNFTVTLGPDAPSLAFVAPAVPWAEPPSPVLDRAGWVLLAAGVVSAGLLGWFLFRWGQVVRLVRRASTASEFAQPIREARRLARLCPPVRVKTVEHPMSPAVCGLFRPVILLPRILAERLSAEQLAAVLLHEVVHLRRRDIWVNCAQSLLQILYWWHPLVWLANARIRRVREEAVDDAVMLALDDDAEIYAPTLLEVARLALRRPLLSLGLVGIMESPSALRQRIERLMAFRAPRRAGLTLASLGGIFLFSAVALPMGEGPAPKGGEMAADASPPLPGTGAVPAISAIPAAKLPAAAQDITNRPAVLITAEIYQMPAANLNNLVSDLTFTRSQAGDYAWWLAAPEAFSNFLSYLEKSGYTPQARPRIQTSSGQPAEFFVGNEIHGTELDCLPVLMDDRLDLTLQGKLTANSAGGAVTNQFQVNATLLNHGGLVIRLRDEPSNAVVCVRVEFPTHPPTASVSRRVAPFMNPGSAESRSHPPVWTGLGRQAIMAKLNQIHFDTVSYDSLPLAEVLRQLSQQCKLRDPEGKGINFLINNNPNLSSGPGTEPTGADGAAVDVGSFLVKLPGLNDVRLADLLNAIVLVADHPLKYSVQDFAIIFSPKAPGTSPAFTSTFRADPNTFYSGLESVGATSFGGAQNGSANGGGQSQNNGAVVGVVNAFPGATALRNTGQGGAGSQGSGSVLNNPSAAGAGDSRLPQSVSDSESPAAMITFRLSFPKPEAELKALLSDAGVNLPPTTFVYNVRAGLLAVRGSPEQLALVNRLVLKLNGSSPQEIESNTVSFVKSINSVPQASDQSTNLYMRTFRVDPHTFFPGLESASGQSLAAPTNHEPAPNTGAPAVLTTQNSSATPSALARALFAKLGVDLANPPGKSVFLNDTLGYLFVKATQSDLDTIERAIEVLNQAPPQLHVKARFYAVPKGTGQGLGQYENATFSVQGYPVGILTRQNATAARQALQAIKGVETLAEPEITSLSGRQVQVRDTENISVVTNLYWETNAMGSRSIHPETRTLKSGPVLDIIPYVLADGYTINLAAIPSVTEFLGYDAPTNRQSVGVDQLPQITPHLRFQQFVATANLWDDQTILLGGLQERGKGADGSKGPAPATEDKELLIFITATIVDSAGRRVHSDQDLPFAQDAVPTQPRQLFQENNGPPVGDFPPYHNGPGGADYPTFQKGPGIFRPGP